MHAFKFDRKKLLKSNKIESNWAILARFAQTGSNWLITNFTVYKLAAIIEKRGIERMGKMKKGRSKIIDNYKEKINAESQQPWILIKRAELIDLVRDIVKEELNNIKSEQKPVCEQEFLNVKQASEFLNLAVTTLYEKTSLKQIPFHKRDKKLYFKKQELIERLYEKKPEAILMKLPVPKKRKKAA